jgi:hypothetical protein
MANWGDIHLELKAPVSTSRSTFDVIVSIFSGQTSVWAGKKQI